MTKPMTKHITLTLLIISLFAIAFSGCAALQVPAPATQPPQAPAEPATPMPEATQLMLHRTF